ncbi:gamma carbonic anhydrase family protein [Petrocella sp. FN5]|uniref:gamma carbonic anhydrase family protein n=1 Tax=Petrocella sp. FN5 TaxID=3032002 RepID=UPI0023DBC08A|nr:gamma carbonic anhydrase family protein [Petrocella sp. FN5]MDF1618212.1 gamma carbonic anhydrase family protein [Petrocella sp. FN5]
MRYKSFEPDIDRSAYVAPGAVIIGQVILKEDVNIWFGAVLRGDVNSIFVDEGANIQDNSTVHVADDARTHIGRHVTIGHNCVIHGCVIGDETLIGMGSTLLDNAVIGKNCIVGANSLVTMGKVFPDGTLIMGSPAKVVRELTEEEILGLKSHAVEYVALSKGYK